MPRKLDFMLPKSKKVRIKDVARLAQVSPARFDDERGAYEMTQYLLSILKSMLTECTTNQVSQVNGADI